MATTKLVLEGEFNWAKVYPENRDMKGYEGVYEECDGAYTIDVLLDEDNFQKLKASGSMKAKNKHPDENGKYKVKFVRKHTAPFEWAGGAPKVIDANGDVFTRPIGNGSQGFVELTVYTTSRKNIIGTRLDAVQITNLVEFEQETVGEEMPF